MVPSNELDCHLIGPVLIPSHFAHTLILVEVDDFAVADLALYMQSSTLFAAWYQSRCVVHARKKLSASQYGMTYDGGWLDCVYESLFKPPSKILCIAKSNRRPCTSCATTEIKYSDLL